MGVHVQSAPPRTRTARVPCSRECWVLHWILMVAFRGRLPKNQELAFGRNISSDHGTRNADTAPQRTGTGTPGPGLKSKDVAMQDLLQKRGIYWPGVQCSSYSRSRGIRELLRLVALFVGESGDRGCREELLTCYLQCCKATYFLLWGHTFSGSRIFEPELFCASVVCLQ